MKANLMFRGKDFNILTDPVFGKSDLLGDLELARILESMAGNDKQIAQVCEAALFSPLEAEVDIEYRQAILKDALDNPQTVRGLYDICVETEELRRASRRWLSSFYLSSMYSSAIDLLQLYTRKLMELRKLAEKAVNRFSSEGFVNLFSLLSLELSDEYFEQVRDHLSELKDGKGTLVSARFGSNLQGVSYVLRSKNRKAFWRRWAFAPSFTIAARDDAGAMDIAKRTERAINESANALAQSAEHLESFFSMLRGELAFYVGCINLRDALQAVNLPCCIPQMKEIDSSKRAWENLYDVSLALAHAAPVVSNTLQTEKQKRLYIITGANQGGKTTFLRSLGQAQLMAQCGIPVGADLFCAPIRLGIFTHFKREEDVTMKSGKLDEELSRMSRITEHLRPGSLMLLNESFSATNEREGSEICGQITRGLRENGIELFSVTHLYAYAASFIGEMDVQFLRAQRLDSGERTFKILPGEPLFTAFGEDLYQKIFEAPVNIDLPAKASAL